jgi:hypothetical protein
MDHLTTFGNYKVVVMTMESQNVSRKKNFKLTHISSMHGASLPMNGEKEFLCVMMKVVKQAAACIEMYRRQATELISRIIYK